MLDAYLTALAPGERLFDLVPYTDSRQRLDEAHRLQAQRRQRDPDYRAGKRFPFDPAARAYDKMRLGRDGIAAYVAAHNLPMTGTGITIRLNRTDGLGARTANFVAPRAFLVDADSPAAVAATIDFIRASGLDPTILVESSPGKLHCYWCFEAGDHVPLPFWSAVQAALARTCGSDASMDDVSQAIRVPGTLHLKGEPHLVRLLWASGPRWRAHQVVRQGRLDLSPQARRKGSRRPRAPVSVVDGLPAATTATMRERRTKHGSANAAFSAGVAGYTPAVLAEAAPFCPLIADALESAGRHHREPLWFLMMALAAFDPDPALAAVRVSCGHPGFSPEDTQAKLARAIETRDAGMGWISCAELSKHSPHCAGCYYRNKGGSPLGLARNGGDA